MSFLQVDELLLLFKLNERDRRNWYVLQPHEREPAKELLKRDYIICEGDLVYMTPEGVDYAFRLSVGLGRIKRYVLDTSGGRAGDGEKK